MIQLPDNIDDDMRLLLTELSKRIDELEADNKQLYTRVQELEAKIEKQVNK